MTEIAPGLRRWTAWHEEWKEDVASYALETDDGLVLIDPLDPPRELRRPAHVVLTVYWHARSTASVSAPHVWAPPRSRQPLARRGVEVTDIVRPGAKLPGGIAVYPTPRAAEVVYWLPAQRAVVPGDVLLGAGATPDPTDDPLRLCPQHWLGKGTHAELREALRPLLDLPVELVLPAHGEPVLRGGREALAAVVGGA